MVESRLEIESPIREYVLPSGKELKIYKKPGSSLCTVAFTTGGELPQALRTDFTGLTAADKAIRNYISSKTPVIKTREQLKNEGKSFLQVQKAIRKQVRKYGPSADQ